MCLNHPQTIPPIPWKHCLPWNLPPVPKSVVIAALVDMLGWSAKKLDKGSWPQIPRQKGVLARPATHMTWAGEVGELEG